MMAGLLRSEMLKAMNVEDLNCSEIRQKARCVGNVVMYERTARRNLYGFTKCPRFQHSGCRISSCWTVFFIVVMVFMLYPVSSFGMPILGRRGADQREQGDNGGRQKRAIVGENVVSAQLSESYSR